MPDDEQAASSREGHPRGDAAGEQQGEPQRHVRMRPSFSCPLEGESHTLPPEESLGLRRRSSRKVAFQTADSDEEGVGAESEPLEVKKLRRTCQRAATVFDEHLEPLVTSDEDSGSNDDPTISVRTSETSTTSSQKRRRASTEPDFNFSSSWNDKAAWSKTIKKRGRRPRRRASVSQKVQAEVADRLLSPFPANTGLSQLHFVKLTWRAHVTCKIASACLAAWIVYIVRSQGLRKTSILEVDLNGDHSLSGLEMSWFAGSVVAFVTGFVVFSRFFLHQYEQYLAWMKAINHSHRFKKLDSMSPFAFGNDNGEAPIIDYLHSHYDTVGATRATRSNELKKKMEMDGTPSGEEDASLNVESAAQRLRRKSMLVQKDTMESVSEYISVIDPAVLSTASHDLFSCSEVTPKFQPQVSPGSPKSPRSRSPRSPCATQAMAWTERTTPAHGLTTQQGGDATRCKLDDVFNKEIEDVTASKLKEFTFKFPEWNFDIFEVHKVTSRPLAFVGFVCLDAYSKLVQVDTKKMVDFLNDVEDSYRQIPYHNSLHGASVARCVYSFCAGYGLAFTQEHFEFTLVLAALVHDVHHPGLTHPFLSKASADGQWKMKIEAPLEEADMDLALKYNDQSPLENMHCAVAMELLRKPKNAFLAKEDVASIRQPLIRAILATDMAKHAENMTRLSALIDNLNHDDDEGALPWYWPTKRPANVKTDQDQEDWARNLQEQFILETFLHAADLSTPTFPFPQWVEWNKRVQAEFHNQGDLERLEFGEFISPPSGFDRNARPEAEHAFTKGFMQYLALPLWEQLNALTQVPCSKSVVKDVNLSICLENLHSNLRQWDTHLEDPSPEEEGKKGEQEEEEEEEKGSTSSSEEEEERMQNAKTM